MKKTSLLTQIDKEKLPKHIAIIMDGNGRWAQKRSLPRIAGHRAGVKVVDKIVTECRKLDIPALTLYSFSEENWDRPPVEINGLMGILKRYLKKELNRMTRENIRFNTIGSIENMSDPIQQLLFDTKEKTKHNDGMVLTLALSYGSQGEIVRAVKRIAQDVMDKHIRVDAISPSMFASYLFTHDLPDPDLLIRTSGELRISNFLLWQIAYTELYFTDLFWPDFTKHELLKAILEFQNRERRYGLVVKK